MKAQREMLWLMLVCGIVVLLSVAGLVWAFTAGLLFPHISLDGLLLVVVCLMMGGLFSIMLFRMAREEGWLDDLRLLRKKPLTRAPASNPADPDAAQNK